MAIRWLFETSVVPDLALDLLYEKFIREGYKFSASISENIDEIYPDGSGFASSHRFSRKGTVRMDWGQLKDYISRNVDELAVPSTPRHDA